MKTNQTINVFSVRARKITPHTVEVSQNGEYVLTCTETGHALFFSQGTDLVKVISEHNDSASKQVPVEDDGSPILTDEQVAQIQAVKEAFKN